MYFKVIGTENTATAARPPRERRGPTPVRPTHRAQDPRTHSLTGPSHAPSLGPPRAQGALSACVLVCAWVAARCSNSGSTWRAAATAARPCARAVPNLAEGPDAAPTTILLWSYRPAGGSAWSRAVAVQPVPKLYCMPNGKTPCGCIPTISWRSAGGRERWRGAARGCQSGWGACIGKCWRVVSARLAFGVRKPKKGQNGVTRHFR